MYYHEELARNLVSLDRASVWDQAKPACHALRPDIPVMLQVTDYSVYCDYIGKEKEG